MGRATRKLQTRLPFSDGDISLSGSGFVVPTIEVIRYMVVALQSAANLGGLSLPSTFSLLQRRANAFVAASAEDRAVGQGGGSDHVFDIISLILQDFRELEIALSASLKGLPRVVDFVERGSVPKASIIEFSGQRGGGAVNHVYDLLGLVDIVLTNLLSQAGGVTPPVSASEIQVFVNGPALPGFTEVFQADSIAVGSVAQTGAAGPFTEHDNQIEIRIANALTATADLTFDPLVLTPTSGYGSGAATLSSAFTSPIVAGASQDRFVQNITDSGLPVAFILDVSITSNDPDESPLLFSITGTFTV